MSTADYSQPIRDEQGNDRRYLLAYDDGVDAHGHAYAANENPHDPDSDAGMGWAEGWTDAMHEANS